MFYKETEFKHEPPLGNVPKEWEVVKLKDVADYLNGYPFSPKDWKDKGLPIIRIQNLNDPDAQFNYFDGDIEDRYIVENGDLLFSWSASIGAYIWNRGKAVLNQHIFKVIPNGSVDKLYLYYVLFLAIEQLKRRVHGSTMKHFKKTELETKIPLPPLGEQKKIAEVLGVVDSVIGLVDRVILKTERLKKGLMQTLLTRGIGHKEYKQTPIGTIPKEWQVVRLAEVTTKIKDMDHKMPKKQEDGIPFISIRYMLKYPDFAFTIDYDDPDLEYISKEDYENQVRRFNVEKNDILYSRFGSIGNAKFVVTEQPFIASYSIVLVKPDREKVSPEFLVCALNSERTRRQARLQTKGATNRNLHLEDIENLKIPIPPMHEQRKIAETLLSVDKKLELEKLEKVRLERIKQSLMDLLLTGKIRVKVD
ncbi:MAG: restriction endonuclease subunit S [Candidatus Bathyarchaeia archaeon]